MNIATPIHAKSPKLDSKVGHTACPHDCPSACALDVDLTDDGRIGRVRGANANSYTAGVICAKVARYAERLYHPDRLMTPKRRIGAKGDGSWQEISWDAALDEIAEAFVKAEAQHGSEAIWPYFYAGTMGQVQRDSIERLRHAKRYSGFFGSICTNMAWTGYVLGTGALRGPDPREMAKSDCVVIWGTNPVATQVNVMTHAVKARKERGAKIVVVDIYDSPTMKQADVKIILKPGTDAALACAVMHIAFRDGYADRDYMAKFADDPAGLEAHLQAKTPEWASAITGLSVEEIEAFARLVGTTKTTIQQVRDRTHWNSASLQPMDPVTLGLCSQIDLDFEVQRAAKDRPQVVVTEEESATLMPAEVSTAPEPAEPFSDMSRPRPQQEEEIDVNSVFAKLKQLKREDEDEE